MTTDPEAIARLTQWLSPAFPVGGYAYSGGLETAIADGRIRAGGDLEAWLSLILRRGNARSDAILVALALDPERDAADLGELSRALAASRERWVETIEQGRAFVRAVRAVEGIDVPDLPLPVAFGLAARGSGLAGPLVVSLYLMAAIGNLISAAVRFVPLGQSEGQAVLARLRPLIVATAAEAARSGPDDLATAAFQCDLAAMRHETQEVRIFRT